MQFAPTSATRTTVPGTSPGGEPVDRVPLPGLDPLVAQQARFRVVGEGALAARALVPATPRAQELFATDRAGTEQALRGVLQVVEAAAGGAAAGRGVRLDGISLSDTPLGMGAATVRAHVEGDPVLRSTFAGLAPGTRDAELRAWAAKTAQSNSSALATAIGGWINLGPVASGPLLHSRGVEARGFDATGDGDSLGRAVRIIRHEAQHVVDSQPRLGLDAARNLREVVAELHSTGLADLQVARRALALDGVVSDASLLRAAQHRPYADLEERTARLLSSLGYGVASARPLVDMHSAELAEVLVQRIAGRTGDDTRQARESLAGFYGAG
ncbi:MAG: hypothetical protein JWM86_2595 [Thermoleophilia bacterium]|nr:hypothetical protein [Thermoleophilia bacterium]